MVRLSPEEKVMGLRVQGDLGYTSGAGLARCGYSRCGASKLFGGGYQLYHTRNGPEIMRTKYRRPTNPQTPAQQAWRAKMQLAWDGYNSLTTDEKKALSIEARKYRLSGPQLYVKRYLQAQAG